MLKKKEEYNVKDSVLDLLSILKKAQKILPLPSSYTVFPNMTSNPAHMLNKVNISHIQGICLTGIFIN